MCSPKYRRAGNLFNKLWMMHKNRMLSAYTASGSMVPLEAVVKAANKAKEIDDKHIGAGAAYQVGRCSIAARP